MLNVYRVGQRASAGDVLAYGDEAAIEAYLRYVGAWDYFMMGRRAAERMKHFDADGGVSWMMFRVENHGNRPTVEAVVGGAGHARAEDNGLVLLRIVDPTPSTLGHFVSVVRERILLDEMQALSYLSQKLERPGVITPWGAPWR